MTDYLSEILSGNGSGTKIRAYRPACLSKAQSRLGSAFDYAINDCGIPGHEFAEMFVVGSISKRMEQGDPAIVPGRSGIEIALEVLEEAGRAGAGTPDDNVPAGRNSRSPEYWAGWAAAFYQWYSCRSFGEIFEAVPYDDLTAMYHPLHEADITKFADIMDQRLRGHFQETSLKRCRMIYRLTQAQLAEQSGVSLRSIQMYEQRNKDINKASAETLYRLAKVFGCPMEELLEK